jgi:hypothetical protein
VDIEQIEEIIRLKAKDLAELKYKVRKERTDKGIKRVTYKQELPSRFRSYLARANKKQIPFTLTVEEFDFIISKQCVYCGTALRIGIDRIDSGDGYVFENCQPCCGTCNMMKFTSDHDTFLKQIRKIHDKVFAR